MQNVKVHDKMKIDPAMSMEDFFSSKAIKIVLYLALASTSFLVLYFTARAGMEKYPSIYSIDAKAENDAGIEAGSEIKIVFNQPVIFFDKKNVKIVPALEFDPVLSGDGKELILKHDEPFSPESKYEVQLKEVRGLSGLAMDDKKFIFLIRSSEIGGNKLDLEDREAIFSQFQLSQNKYIPPQVSTPKVDLEIEPEFKEGKYIDVSIDYQTMTLFEDGAKVNSFLVSSGIPGMSTPLGTYSVKKKEDNHWSGYGLWMPYSMNFSGPYYIHELPYWPGGYREGENHLGIKASHGCIRLGIGPAKYVYDWAEIGTPVFIHK